MRKSLLASLVFAAIAAPVMADGTVTLYGIANVPFQLVKTAGAGNTMAVGSGPAPAGANTSSRLGFKGDEDLGAGLKAWWQIETQVGLDDAAASSFASREGWVGLSDSWGKLGLGRGKSPYKNVADVFDSQVDGGSNLAIQKHAILSNVNTDRPDNSVRFDTANYDGFTAAVQFGAGENKTTTVEAGRKWSLNARYTQPTWSLAAAYNQEKNVGAVAVDGTKNVAYLFAGTYTIDALKLGLGYQHATLETAVGAEKKEGDSAVVSAIYTLGDVAFKAGAIFNQRVKLGGKSVDGSDYLRYSLGAKYSFSKRTAFYTEFTGDDYNKDIKGANKSDVNVFSLGLIHNF